MQLDESTEATERVARLIFDRRFYIDPPAVEHCCRACLLRSAPDLVRWGFRSGLLRFPKVADVRFADVEVPLQSACTWRSPGGLEAENRLSVDTSEYTHNMSG
jgi:hypothetical protein